MSDSGSTKLSLLILKSEDFRILESRVPEADTRDCHEITAIATGIMYTRKIQGYHASVQQNDVLRQMNALPKVIGKMCFTCTTLLTGS